MYASIYMTCLEKANSQRWKSDWGYLRAGSESVDKLQMGAMKRSGAGLC